MSAPLWVALVNWNGGELLLECLRSLVAAGVPAEQIVVVDNGSTDGSREAVERALAAVRLVRNTENVGYGHGTNQGIELALAEGAQLVFLVNNDVTVPAGSVDLLASALAADPGLGIVGPRVAYLDEPDRLWGAGGRITFRTNMNRMLGHGAPDGPRWQVRRDVDYVPGCAMLVRREVFDRIGLLDGEFFAYHEDVEFCLHAREAGFGVRLIGDALVLHAAHRSTGGGYNPRRKYMMGVNTVWFLRRHGTSWRWISFFVFDILSLPFAWAYRVTRGEGAAVVAKARGIRDGFLGRRVSADLLRTQGEGRPGPATGD